MIYLSLRELELGINKAMTSMRGNPITGSLLNLITYIYTADELHN